MMPDIRVEVLSASMGDIVGTLNGLVTVDGKKYKFVGTAFGRYGGHNVSVRLSPQARKSLKNRGYDADEIEMAVQETIVTGNFIMKESTSVSGEPLNKTKLFWL